MGQQIDPTGGESAEAHRKPRLGVAVLVTDREGRLLLGQRGKHPNHGKWVIPGGGVRFGEPWSVAGERELLEETGLKIRIDDRQRPFIVEVLGGDEHRVILCVTARLVGGALRASSDLLEARFFPRGKPPREEISPVVLPLLEELGWVS